MKRDEVIKILGETTLCSPLKQAAFAAIEDVRLQMPREIFLNSEADRQYEDYICPNCKDILQQKVKGAKAISVYHFKHCPNCGQALIW